MTKLSDNSDSDLATQFSLIEQAKANDAAAWEAVFLLYAPLIKRWARFSGVTCPHEIDNVCQEVFTKMVKHLSSFQKRKTGGSFRGWLRVITRNHICSHHLGNKKFQTVGGSSWQKRLGEIPFNNSAASMLDSGGDENRDDKVLIFRQIMAWVDEKYSDKQKAAFMRLVIDLSPARDVAEELGLTVNVVYQYKSRILASIREAFDDLV